MKEAVKEAIWESTVAMAVPAALRSNTATSRRSKKILIVAAMIIKTSGRLLSPIPRRMPHTAL